MASTGLLDPWKKVRFLPLQPNVVLRFQCSSRSHGSVVQRLERQALTLIAVGSSPTGSAVVVRAGNRSVRVPSGNRSCFGGVAQ